MRQREGEGMGEGREREGNEKRQKETQSRRDTVYEKCPLLFASYGLVIGVAASTFRESRTLSVKQNRLREGFPPVGTDNLNRDR